MTCMTIVRSLTGAVLMLATGLPAWAEYPGEKPAGAERLAERIQTLSARPGLGGLPLYTETEVGEGVAGAEAVAVIGRGFSQVTALLGNGGTWCEVVALHPNIKACVHEPAGDRQRIVFYTGTRYFQPARLSRAHSYDLEVDRHGAGYFLARLWPGPEKLADGARPALIEAVDLGDGRSGLRVYYRQTLSTWARMAAAAYFATFGRGKVGFSTHGADRDGNPIYADGMRGAIERNVVRYFLAIETHLEAGEADPASRFEQRLANWYARTEYYARQLHEQDREDYLDTKKHEQAQQAVLQREIDARRESSAAAAADER